MSRDLLVIFREESHVCEVGVGVKVSDGVAVSLPALSADEESGSDEGRATIAEEVSREDAARLARSEPLQQSRLRPLVTVRRPPARRGRAASNASFPRAIAPAILQVEMYTAKWLRPLGSARQTLKRITSRRRAAASGA